MSAKGRGAIRQPDDHYVTPEWAIDVILPHLPTNGLVVDAGCGSGAIFRRIERRPHTERQIIGVEMDPGRALEASRWESVGNKRVQIIADDFLSWSRGVHCDLVIMNPPFALSLEFVEASIAMTRRHAGTVAALLRVNWLAAEKRGPLLGRFMPDPYVLTSRPSFCISARCSPAKKTGKASCGWRVSLPPGSKVPRPCPQCGERVTDTATDATEYAWMVWRPGCSGRVRRLARPKEPARTKEAA